MNEIESLVQREEAVKTRHTLTPKQILYLKARIEGKSKNEAKAIAGYSEKSNSYRIENGNKNNASLKEALVAVGLSEDYLAEKIKHGTNAEKTQYFAFEGKVTDERTMPDWDARHKFTKTALEIRGDLEGQGVNLNLGLIAINDEKNIKEWGKDVENKIS